MLIIKNKSVLLTHFNAVPGNKTLLLIIFIAIAKESKYAYIYKIQNNVN